MNTFTSVGTASCNTSSKFCSITITSQSTTKAYIIGETTVAS